MDPPGASQRKVSGDESLASILLLRSLERPGLVLLLLLLLLLSPLAAPPEPTLTDTHVHYFNLNKRIRFILNKQKSNVSSLLALFFGLHLLLVEKQSEP